MTMNAGILESLFSDALNNQSPKLVNSIVFSLTSLGMLVKVSVPSLEKEDIGCH